MTMINMVVMMMLIEMMMMMMVRSVLLLQQLHIKLDENFADQHKDGTEGFSPRGMTSLGFTPEFHLNIIRAQRRYCCVITSLCP